MIRLTKWCMKAIETQQYFHVRKNNKHQISPLSPGDRNPKQKTAQWIRFFLDVFPIPPPFFALVCDQSTLKNLGLVLKLDRFYLWFIFACFLKIKECAVWHELMYFIIFFFLYEKSWVKFLNFLRKRRKKNMYCTLYKYKCIYFCDLNVFSFCW